MWRHAFLLALVGVVRAQIPSLGWCPDYQPMANFDMNRFLGQWHEAERYFTVTEVGSRCVTTNYEKMADGRVWVSNEIRNSFTGVKRVVEGQLQVVGRDGEGKILVKYTSLPVPYEAQYVILDTDYKTYAVMWSCNGIGPIHAQSAWVMTRDRLAPGLVLQKAYGVLDKYKISRAFFVRTNQEDCTVQPNPIEAVDPIINPENEEENQKEAQGKNAVEAPLEDHQGKDKRENKPAEAPAKSVLPVPELIKASAEEGSKPAEKEQKPAEEPAKAAVKSENANQQPAEAHPAQEAAAVKAAPEKAAEQANAPANEAVAVKSAPVEPAAPANPAAPEKAASEAQPAAEKVEAPVLKKVVEEKAPAEQKAPVEHNNENKEKVVAEKQ